MTTKVLDMKMSFLLDVADRIQSYLASKINPTDIVELVKKAAKAQDAIVAHDMIASETYEFMIVATNPRQLLIDIVELMRVANSPLYQTTFNPINIITKLIDREYMLDVGGNRLCYSIKTTIPSNYLLKSFACRKIASVRSYYNYVDDESMTIESHKIKELHPLFDYRTNSNRDIGGGKRHVKTSVGKKKGNDRMNIISRLIEFVRGNSVISSGIIFANELQECSSSAINIFYTENKFKEAIVDYMKLLVANSYSHYSFKTFLHADFAIPNDFRMKKHSCLINDKTTNQATYVANLYNNATYEPIPCIKSFIHDSYIQMTHPIVKLRMLYIDMFLIEHRTGSANPINHERVYYNKMLKAFNDLQTYEKTPSWVGYFIDEPYDKLKFNMKMKMVNPIDTILI